MAARNCRSVLLGDECTNMALIDWAHLGLQLVHDLSHFLLFGSLTDPLPFSSSTTSTPRIVSSGDSVSSPLSNLTERTIDYIAGWVGISLPRAVTIVTGLPAATIFLLRLTEIVPPEFVLFLCLSGLIAWMTVLLSIGTIPLVLIIRALVRWCRRPRPSVGVVTFAPDHVTIPDAEDTPPSSPGQLTHSSSLPLTVDMRTLGHPALSPSPAFSDAALSLTDTVAAHSSVLSLAPPVRQRPTTRSATHTPRKPGRSAVPSST